MDEQKADTDWEIELMFSTTTTIHIPKDINTAIVSYKGNRETFVKEGSLDFIIQIYGSLEKANEYLESYRAMDGRPRWFETMADYYKRAPLRELRDDIAQLIANAKKGYSISASNIEKDVVLWARVPNDIQTAIGSIVCLKANIEREDRELAAWMALEL